MKKLPNNWFYSDLVDAEYKRYLLLAYLGDVQQLFNQNRLYPQLADLIMHFRNLQDFIKLKTEFESGLHKTAESFDLNAFRIAYNSVVSNDDLMKIIEEIVQYSLPQIQKKVEEGKEIYEFIEGMMKMDPVGILPIYKNEGYLIIRDGSESDLNVYRYEVKLFENQHTRFRAISTTFVDQYRKSIVNTGENIKIDLIRKHKKLPNPATFAVYTDLEFPMEDTLLQIVKRRLNSFIDPQ